MTFQTCALTHSFGRFVLLAPPSGEDKTRIFTNRLKDARTHARLIDEMQRLRGRIYLEDGAITQSALDSCGRHKLPKDKESWHLLALNESDQVQGCIRILPGPAPLKFEELAIGHSALAMSDRWSTDIRKAVNSEIERSQSLGVNFFEVGGWALDHKLRFTRAALCTALGTYALAQLLGGAVGLATATVRNCSASILKRLGGKPLRGEQSALPSYFDPKYGCQMEALSFDSERPNAVFARQIEAIREGLRHVPVVCLSESKVLPFVFSSTQQDPLMQQLSLAG